MTIEKVIENIKAIGSVDSLKDLNDEVICAFENYSFKGQNSIIFDDGNGNGYDYIAHADHRDAPEILVNVDIERNDDNEITRVTITDAWIS